MVAGGLQRQLRSFRRSVGACPTFSLHSLTRPQELTFRSPTGRLASAVERS